MRVYTFGNGAAEGRADMVARLGGKGAGLAGMSRLGVDVPPGFTIPTEACQAFFTQGGQLPEGLWTEIERGLTHIESIRGRHFGDLSAPLLVSVRSGAAVSMPGMMDTILNVGLSAAAVPVLGAETKNLRFALDSRRRLLEMYAEIALGLDPGLLLNARDEVLEMARCHTVSELSEPILAGLIATYEAQLSKRGHSVPEAPKQQLREAVCGVFSSWNTRRARRFRAQEGISDDLGTAVTVQAMVFGNLGESSATGVAFTRDPNTGEPCLFGEYLPNAQGEDVVSGRHTPLSLTKNDVGCRPAESLEVKSPEVFAQLEAAARLLEQKLGDVQDIEFTIEQGKVWMLQTRSAHRSVRAAVRTAVDMVDEGLIDQRRALLRVEPERLARLLHPSVDVHAHRKVLARGLPASPGAVSGVVIFDPEEVVRRSQAGERVILVRVETSAEDMEAIRAAVGVLTSRGGMTSHAALVARGLERSCVTGCADIIVNERENLFMVRNEGVIIERDTVITLDGSSGEVILGEVATIPADPPPAYGILMGWADEVRRLKVHVNADHLQEATSGLAYHADGIGLSRTEHMFLEGERLKLMHELVFADGARARAGVVARLLPIQREDFSALFKEAGDRLVGIRLLDIPLHDVVSDDRRELAETAKRLELPVDVLVTRARQLRAANPLLGHRGCRLGLTFPEVYEVQVRAAFEAALTAEIPPTLQIIIPLVTAAEEMRRLRRRIEHIAKQVARGRTLDFTIGPMVESPRACLLADELVEFSDFLLFGINDLTSAVFYIHRDDAGRYLPFYLENDILEADPFVEMDRSVATLIRGAITRARAKKPGLLCGLSGAQANSARTVALCHQLGLDYVTCAAHRVPIARLAAAQAQLKDPIPLDLGQEESD